MRPFLRPDLREFCVVQITVVSFAVALGILAYIIAEFMRYDELPMILKGIDVGHERSVQTFLSTMNLMLASVLIFAIYRYEKISAGKAAGYWLFLSALFLFLSFDEFASIHEKYARIYAHFVDVRRTLPVFESHQWLPVGILFVLVVFLILLPFLRALTPATRWSFMTAGAVFVAGAIGFEFLGALMIFEGVVDSRSDVLYRVRRIGEESLEMYGIVIFNCALYREILRRDRAIASPVS